MSNIYPIYLGHLRADRKIYSLITLFFQKYDAGGSLNLKFICRACALAILIINNNQREKSKSVLLFIFVSVDHSGLYICRNYHLFIKSNIA